MNKVLIPTKLSDVAANTLKTAGYEVIRTLIRLWKNR